MQPDDVIYFFSHSKRDKRAIRRWREKGGKKDERSGCKGQNLESPTPERVERVGENGEWKRKRKVTRQREAKNENIAKGRASRVVRTLCLAGAPREIRIRKRAGEHTAYSSRADGGLNDGIEREIRGKTGAAVDWLIVLDSQMSRDIISYVATQRPAIYMKRRYRYYRWEADRGFANATRSSAVSDNN